MFFVLAGIFMGLLSHAQASVQALPPYSARTVGTENAADYEERDFLAIINRFRAALRLQKLSIDPRLKEAAAGHAEWMSQQWGGRGVLTHFGPSIGWGSAARMRAQGIEFDASVGENIARGSYTAKNTFIQWFFSVEHLEGMLTSEYTHIGIARRGCDESEGETVDNNEWYCFWVTDFASLPELKAAQKPPRIQGVEKYDIAGFSIESPFEDEEAPEIEGQERHYTDQELFAAAEKVVGILPPEKVAEFENPHTEP